MPQSKSEKEKDELFRKNKKGDLQARDELFSLNIPLVLAMVRRMARGREDFEDLFQEGSMGLLKALQNFDPAKGTRFSTYAVPFILGQMRSYLRKNGQLAKVSRSYYEHYIQLQKKQAEMEQELQRPPRLEELAEKLGLEREEVVWLSAMEYPTASLNEESIRRQHPELGEDKVLLTDDIDDTLFIKEQLGNLPARERQIIVFRYIMGKSQQETARLLNLSQKHISRLEREILKKMKEQATP